MFRYALICSQCRAHNGMALCEEFEQINYFCFKCGTYNPSRNDIKAVQQRRNSVSSYNRSSYGSVLPINGGLSRSNYDMRMTNTRTPSIVSLTTTGCIENGSGSIQTDEHSRENTDTSKNSSVSGDEQPPNESIYLS